MNDFQHGEGQCFIHKTGEEYASKCVCDEPVDLKLFQHDGPLIDDNVEDEVHDGIDD